MPKRKIPKTKKLHPRKVTISAYICDPGHNGIYPWTTRINTFEDLEVHVWCLSRGSMIEQRACFVYTSVKTKKKRFKVIPFKENQESAKILDVLWNIYKEMLDNDT